MDRGSVGTRLGVGVAKGFDSHGAHAAIILVKASLRDAKNLRSHRRRWLLL
jgi:hypothetical protein